MNALPIALAFAGSVVLFASWVLFMTRELWWPTVEPSYEQLCHALEPARVKVADARIRAAHAGVALGHAGVKVAHQLGHQLTALASRPRAAPNNWWRMAGWPHGWRPSR